jgi:hypothetical protein
MLIFSVSSKYHKNLLKKCPFEALFLHIFILKQNGRYNY